MKKRVRWLLLTLTLLILYHPQTAEASDDKTMKTYTWGTRDDFKNLIGSDTYKKYGSKFNFGKSELYVKGGKEPLDLEDTVIIEETGKDTGIYRYQFWVRSNNLKNNSWCWKTEFYMGTRNPVGNGSDPSSYVAKGTKIERLVAEETAGTFFKSDGEGTTASGDSGTASNSFSMDAWMKAILG